MIRSRKARLSAGVVLGVCGMAAVMAPLVALSGPARAATPGPNTPEKVASGVNVSALPGARAFGATPDGVRETVSFVLKERNLGLLQAQAQTGFRHYLSVGQFAASYGQTPDNIAALTGYLAGFGITTKVYADDVVVVATGTAGQFDKALSVSQKQFDVPALPARGGQAAVPAQRGVHANLQAPLLPYRLSSFVLAVLGLSNYAPFASQSVHVNHAYLRPRRNDANCLALTGLDGACNTPADFAARYGLRGLTARGADGAGQTLAIVTLAAVDPGAPEYFWQNVAQVPDTGRTLSVRDVDGGPGAPSEVSGSAETDLDLEQAGSLAPGADVLDYQAPNTDYGFADAFFTAASENLAGTVSSSWGESETLLAAAILSGQEAATYNAAFDEAFLEFAAQGQSGFIASGDSGAYEASRDLGTTNLSVQSNSDSPFITAAGGTTLPWSGTLFGSQGSTTVSVRAERAWGWDYLWAPIAQVTGDTEADVAMSNVVGSGGGFSKLEPTPLYQAFVPGTHNFAAVRYLTPTSFQTVAPGLTEPTQWTFNPAPAVTGGYANGRAVPDLSADADPYTGYLIYSPSLSGPALEGGWGGTSFVAPQLNGAAAVIDSLLGHRTGFWNPAIYAAATLRFASPFTPLDASGTSNDNLYFTGIPGQPYNQGVGLGIPNLTRLAGVLH